jgi:hypothetical protein
VIVTGRDEAQARSLFQVRYRTTPSLLTRQIEQRVIGGDWGANGFTTMAQADTLARELHLSAADPAASEGLLARTGVVASAASGLPFRAGSFDVIIHTDVLC